MEHVRVSECTLGMFFVLRTHQLIGMCQLIYLGKTLASSGVEVTVHIKSDVPEAIISDKIWIQVQVSLYVLLH